MRVKFLIYIYGENIFDIVVYPSLRGAMPGVAAVKLLSARIGGIYAIIADMTELGDILLGVYLKLRS